MRAEERSELLPLLCGFPHTSPRSPYREKQNLHLAHHAGDCFFLCQQKATGDATDKPKGERRGSLRSHSPLSLRFFFRPFFS